METEDHLTWEKLKKSLIARYGGRRLEILVRSSQPYDKLGVWKNSLRPLSCCLLRWDDYQRINTWATS
ncbi:hypothetical protein A2U01_0066138 [Trifolium medium]|uniref:Uncharacterized protein n=1 Tax=Trifolium medium TaxID=97028 RepID=A0A392S886_9FABA|nr:hypothetical protein [Trifolium medium]